MANKRRQAGDDVTTALVVAGKTRLRPIVMTTLAAIGGLFPLALGLGSGSEMEKPLAIAVIGGLSTATLFTLVVIPVLYAAFAGTGRARESPTVAATTAALLAVALAVATPGVAGAQAPAAAQSPSPGLSSGQILTFTNLPLETAEQAAVDASPDVRTARANAAQQNAVLAQARGAYGLSANVGYAESPQGSPEGTISSRITSYGVGVTLGDLMAFSPLLAQAAAGARQAQIDVVVAEREERIKAVGLYFSALKARALLASRRDLATAAHVQVESARKRFGAGDVPRLDVIRADVAAARADADVANAQAADANAADALAHELNVPHDRLDATSPVTMAHTTALDGNQAVSMASTVRSELRSADENVSAARAGVAAARRTAFPLVTLGAGYNRGVDSGFAIGGPTVSVQLTLPLAGTASPRIAAQRALLEQAEAKRASVVRTIQLDVAAAARNAQAAVTAESATSAAYRAANEELVATTIGYRSGSSSSFEVDAARSAYGQALNDFLAAVYDRAQTQAVLVMEVGK